jgi:hypothetical protein
VPDDSEMGSLSGLQEEEMKSANDPCHSTLPIAGNGWVGLKETGSKIGSRECGAEVQLLGVEGRKFQNKKGARSGICVGLQSLTQEGHIRGPLTG